MAERVSEQPALPSFPSKRTEAALWDYLRISLRSTFNLFRALAIRANSALTKDGMDRMTAPLPLVASTVAGLSAYPAADWAGSILYVSNGTSNKRLAISDGTNWRFPDGNVVS